MEGLHLHTGLGTPMDSPRRKWLTLLRRWNTGNLHLELVTTDIRFQISGWRRMDGWIIIPQLCHPSTIDVTSVLTLSVFDGGQLLVHGLVSRLGEGLGCGAVAVVHQVRGHHPDTNKQETSVHSPSTKNYEGKCSATSFFHWGKLNKTKLWWQKTRLNIYWLFPQQIKTRL